MATEVSKKYNERVRSVSSAGEHHVDIVGVTGSIPVRSTIFLASVLLADTRKDILFWTQNSYAVAK